MTRGTTFASALLLAALALAFGLAVLGSRLAATTAQAQREPSAAAAGRYTVVETEATNLIVVDNATSTLYFYCTDPEKEAGTELRLRGSIDLKQVGKPVMRATKAGK